MPVPTPSGGRAPAVRPDASPETPPTPLPPALRGLIVEWDETKDFGFLEFEQERIFLHRRDFAEFHKQPEVGDRVWFDLGADELGRTCARRASHVNDGGKLEVTDWIAVGVLLLLPGAAIRRGLTDWIGWSVAGFALGVSVLTYLLYDLDKRAARRGEGRTSERFLHFLELVGGWPGAYLAQCNLRHKRTKVSYQITFWVIVMLHQFVALDSCRGWHLLGRFWS